MITISYDLFSNGLLHKILVGQHLGQHRAKFASRGVVMLLAGASIAPKRLSELLSESARQATRDQIGAPPPASSGFVII